MTPNFALSLSFDGIRLLHRVSGGWHLAGEAVLDDPDLGGELAKLRDIARALDPSELRVKLLIPNEQIKYLAIDSTRTNLDDIRDALNGATPYAIDELAFDFDRNGGRTHIAAVARETLAEAEAFAVEHNFNPICFAAIPEPFTLNGEVFFGPTKAATTVLAPGETVERDAAPVAVIGAAVVPTPQATAVPKAPAISLDPPPEPDTLPTSMTLDPAQAEPAADSPDIVFASRARPAVTERPTPTPFKPLPTVSDSDEPLFTSRSAPRIAPPAPSTAAPLVAAPDTTPVPVTAPEFSTTRPPIAAPAATSAPTTTDDPENLTAFGARKTKGKPRFLGLILTVILLIFMAIVAIWASTLSEDGLAGLFSRDAPTEVATADPALLPEPTVETAALAPEPTPDPVNIPEPTLSTETGNPLPILNTTPLGQVLSPAEANRIYAATGVWQRAPRLPLQPRLDTLGDLNTTTPAISQTALPEPKQPDLTAQGPDPVISTPRNPPAAGVTFPRDSRGFILATPEGTITPDGLIVFAGSPDIVPPLRPGTVIPGPVIVATTPDGLPIVAGRPAITPPARPADIAPLPAAPTLDASTPDVSTLADTTPSAPPQDDAVDLPTIAGAPQTVPPLRPSTITADAAPDTDGPTTETPEITAISGRPPNAPPVRPATIEQAAIAARPAAPTAGGVSLSSLQDTPADPIIDPTTDQALASIRPQIRPAGLAPEPTTPEEPDINAVLAAIAQAAPASPFVSPTARAVQVSKRPDPRPRNFATVVARAQAATARQQTRAAATSTAPSTATTASAPAPAPVSSGPAAPSGPVPGGVARAATLDNAIRLRDINLIGVFGRPNDRRALIRLSNGRMVRVKIGDRLDGGQVTAIGDSALNYVKRGRTYALQLPAG